MIDLFATKRHDPGGLVRIRLPSGVIGSALFGGERDEYRYRLSRTWRADRPRVLFVMMNPSTASPAFDDPTVAKCGRFARKWFCGGVDIANTFAYRATDQSRLLEVDDPVGPDNDEHIAAMARSAQVVIFAYGQPKHRKLRQRGRDVAKMLVGLGIHPYVLRLSKDGIPMHPLYLPETLQPQPWTVFH